MSSARTRLLIDEIDQLPSWAARMARKYYAGEASHFLLYSNQVAVIINFLDTIIPAGDVSYMSGDDRTNLVAFQRWITSSRLLKKDNIVILVAESVAEIHPRIRQNSRLAAIDIAYPDEAERLAFIAHLRVQLPHLSSEVTDEQLSLTTSGLDRVNLNSLMR